MRDCKKYCTKPKIKFIRKKENAKLGDILLNNGLFINVKEYLKNKYDINSEPVGIVAIESSIMPDNKIRIMSLDYMDYNTPTTGSLNGVPMVFGANGNISGLSYFTQVPIIYGNNKLNENIQSVNERGFIPMDHGAYRESLTKGYVYAYNLENASETAYYHKYSTAIFLEDGTLNPVAFAKSYTVPGTSTVTNITNPFTDLNGQSNTEKYKITATKPTNSTAAGNYPAVHCCKLYEKEDYKDWYLPSCGELVIMASKSAELLKVRTKLGYTTSINGHWYWSSTLADSSRARGVNFGSGGVGNGTRSSLNDDIRVLAMSAF